MRTLVRGGLVVFGLVVCLGSGCAVPQPPGKGKLQLVTEKTLNWPYWLYLPEEYMAQKKRGVKTPVHPATESGKWPLVVSFHGMKPFDNCLPQAQEWQEESDRYGFITIAPQLNSCDITMQFPLRDPNLWYVQNDVKRSYAIMQEVMREHPVDPNKVLSTSWSSGGYIAHLMVNRYPHLFSVLAVRQSNFQADLLDPKQIPKYRDMPITVFWTQNDFAICQSESREAVQWYRRHGFRNFTWGILGQLGHERTPHIAAAYFAMQYGLKPRTPSKFPRILEGHRGLHQAVAYGMRAQPRSARMVSGQRELTNTTVANGSNSKEEASSEKLVGNGTPSRTQRNSKTASPEPRKTRAEPKTNRKANEPQERQAFQPKPEPKQPEKRVRIARTPEPKAPPRTRILSAEKTTGGSLQRPQPRRSTPSSSNRGAWKQTGPRTASPDSSNVHAPYKAVHPPPNTDTTRRRTLPVVDRTRGANQAAQEPVRRTSASQEKGKVKNPTPVAPPVVPQRLEPTRTAVEPEPVPAAPRRTREAQTTPPARTVGAPRRVASAPKRSELPKRIDRTNAGTRVQRATTLSPKPTRHVPPAQAFNPPARVQATTHRPEPVRSLGQGRKPSPASPWNTNGDAQSVKVHVSPALGMSPCRVRFRAELPPGKSSDNCDALWLHNGQPLSNGLTGASFFVEPGEHRLEVLVITDDNRELRGSKIVTVLPKRGGSQQRRPTQHYGVYR